MIRTRIAQRYARALFELTQEAGKIELAGQQLGVLQEVMDTDTDLRTALLSPVLPRTAKTQVLEAVIAAAQVDDLVGNLLRVLLEARKLVCLADILHSYQAFADEAAGRVRGEAVTSMPLPPGDVETLREALAKALDKEVYLATREDPSILGGLVARVGNLVLDGSLRTQLVRMKETLIKG